jgi:hypothetical protein
LANIYPQQKVIHPDIWTVIIAEIGGAIREVEIYAYSTRPNMIIFS